MRGKRKYAGKTGAARLYNPQENVSAGKVENSRG